MKPGENFYVTDAFSDNAVKFLDQHGREGKDAPFFLHLCYTAPHFPLHAKPEDIAKYRGHYRDGWDRLRERRFARQKELGLLPPETKLSRRDPVAKAWDDVPAAERDEWDLRMAVYAAMIDCMDQGVGRVMEAVDRLGARENTLVLFLSDNGASAEALDSWPNPGAAIAPARRPARRNRIIVWKSAGRAPPTRRFACTKCGITKGVSRRRSWRAGRRASRRAAR